MFGMREEFVRRLEEGAVGQVSSVNAEAGERSEMSRTTDRKESWSRVKRDGERVIVSNDGDLLYTESQEQESEIVHQEGKPRLLYNPGTSIPKSLSSSSYHWLNGWSTSVHSLSRNPLSLSQPHQEKQGERCFQVQIQT